VAEALAALDVRDGTGKHPTAECARQSWEAVKKAKRVKPAPARPVASPALPPALAPAADPGATFVDSRDAAKARMLAQFKPVTVPRKEH